MALRREKLKRMPVFQIVLLVAFLLSTTNAVTTSSVFWDDGQTHIINDDTYVQEGYQYYIYSDFNINSNPPTQVNLVDGGTVGSLRAFNSSIITMSGGTAGFLQSWQNSKITMSGGTADYLEALDDGIIIISGGFIVDRISAGENGIIYLRGTDFEVEGQILNYGDKLSDFVPIIGGGGDPYYAGNVTGTLFDGTTLNCYFRIYNTGFNEGTADIIIIPEPTTLSLLALGAVLLKRKR